MTRVAALTSGRLVPSARFRVRQHIGPLRRFGIEVREYVPAIEKYEVLEGWPPGSRLAAKLLARVPAVLASYRHDVTWLQRELVTGYPTLEGFLKRPFVLDVDDAIWLSPPLGGAVAAAAAKRADIVVAGNAWLAEWFSRHNRSVHVVPTAVDTEHFRQASPSPDEGPFVVGWIGTSGNLRFLEDIGEAIARFLRDHKDARLLVVCDRRPALASVPGERWEYVPWSQDVEVTALQRMDVGLMPLANDEWSRGKCSLKMLQYMACSVAVVVSPVGMNAEVLSMGQVGMAATTEKGWYEALSFFYTDRAKRVECGRNGRALIEAHFSREHVCERLAGIFRNLGG